MSRRNWKSQRHPAISAAFTRETPETFNGAPRQRPFRQPMSDEELKAWSDQQAERFGVHKRAAEAAARGRTLMVFLQAESRSVPYDEYRARLDAGELPIGNTKPLQIKLDGSEEPAVNTAKQPGNNGDRPSRRSAITREAGRINAGSMTEEELAAEFGLHGEDLADLLAETGIPAERETAIYPHSDQAIAGTNPVEIPQQPGAEAA